MRQDVEGTLNLLLSMQCNFCDYFQGMAIKFGINLLKIVVSLKFLKNVSIILISSHD